MIVRASNANFGEIYKDIYGVTVTIKPKNRRKIEILTHTEKPGEARFQVKFSRQNFFSYFLKIDHLHFR